ncbi:MAG: DUF4364 family protein [Clostridia bacterium]|nr:DUF4364 family protein [Clostridia bacterium]
MSNDLVTNKILLLFVLEKYEIPITKENIFQMCCIDNTWIPYLFVEQILDELINSKMIICREDRRNQDTKYYEITEDGHTCLMYFYENIFKSTREEIASYIRSQKLNYRIKQELTTKIELTQDRTYNVRCLIKQETHLLCEFKIYNVPTKKKANEIAQLWPSVAPQLYKFYVDIQTNN